MGIEFPKTGRIANLLRITLVLALFGVGTFSRPILAQEAIRLKPPKLFGAGIDYGEPISVLTPDQGGDGRSEDDPKAKKKGLRSASGTMKDRDEALKEKSSATLTTD